jgi:hypothetical protein
MVARLQVKACHIGKILSSLEKRYDDNSKKDPAADTQPTGGMRKSSSTSIKQGHLRIDPIPPFNVNKIKKSPCAELPPAAVTETTDNKTDDLRQKEQQQE